MSNERMPVYLEIKYIDAIPEIQMIDMLMAVYGNFGKDLSMEEKARTVDYFYRWSKDTNEN